MNLFLIVWEYKNQEQDCDWTHVVSDKPYLSTSDEEKIIIEFMKDNFEYSKKETLDSLYDFWSNKIDVVDGYKIEVVEKTKVDPEAFNKFLGMNIEEELDKLTIRKKK